jgi:hypothetical protein
MATRNGKHVLSFKDLDFKILLQKVVTILVIQAAIYGVFIIVDPGFLDSLIMYFTVVAIFSVVLVVWVHVRNVMEELRV